MGKQFLVRTARDDRSHLQNVLEEIRMRYEHVHIVSVMWEPKRPSGHGNIEYDAGYTIVAEVED